MALAIAGSGPPFYSDNGSTGSVTSAAFTPPAGSRLWAFSTYDAGSGFVSITFSSTPALTWVPVFSSMATNAWCFAAYADVSSSVSTTVTSALIASSVFSGASLYVAVVTGGETTPLINASTTKTSGNAGTSWQPNLPIVATASNSIIVASAAGFSGTTAWTAPNTADGAPGPYAQQILGGWSDAGLYQGTTWRITPVTVAGNTYTPKVAGANEQGNIGVVEIRSGIVGPTVTAELYEGGVLKQTLGTALVSADGIFSFTWDAATLTALSGANVELRLSSNSGMDIGAVEWNAWKTGAQTYQLTGTSAGTATTSAAMTVIPGAATFVEMWGAVSI